MQYGALPYRMTGAGALEFMLVTTRESKRWIIPKGWPMKGLKPSKCAAIEAYEEAGVRGAIDAKSIGAFSYEKRIAETKSVVPCEVRVFPLNVKRQYAVWPEAHERQARWFEPVGALSAIEDISLRELIALFMAKIAASPLK